MARSGAVLEEEGRPTRGEIRYSRECTRGSGALAPSADSELSSGSPSSWFGKPWACSAGGAHRNLWRQDRARGQGACSVIRLLGERERGSDGNSVTGDYEPCRAGARSFCPSTGTMDCAAAFTALFAN